MPPSQAMIASAPTRSSLPWPWPPETISATTIIAVHSAPSATQRGSRALTPA